MEEKELFKSFMEVSTMLSSSEVQPTRCLPRLQMQQPSSCTVVPAGLQHMHTAAHKVLRPGGVREEEGGQSGEEGCRPQGMPALLTL